MQTTTEATRPAYSGTTHEADVQGLNGSRPTQQTASGAGLPIQHNGAGWQRWTLRCVLYRLRVWRQRRVVHDGSAWRRTTLLGIRMGSDRWMYDVTD